MFARTLFVALSLASAALASFPASYAMRGEFSALDRRASQPVAVACYTPNAGDCDCPQDNNEDVGVLINVFPGYQCAYPGGACTWDDKTGELQNKMQTNCPTEAPCTDDCSCPIDNNLDTGVMINAFKGYQCAYVGGACMWDGQGNLVNTHQTNCPTQAKCEKLVAQS